MGGKITYAGRRRVTEQISSLFALSYKGDKLKIARALGMPVKTYSKLINDVLKTVEDRFFRKAWDLLSGCYGEQELLAKIRAKSLSEVEHFSDLTNYPFSPQRPDAEYINRKFVNALYLMLCEKGETRKDVVERSGLPGRKIDNWLYYDKGVPVDFKLNLEKRAVSLGGDDLPMLTIAYIVNSGLVADEEEFKFLYPHLTRHFEDNYGSLDVVFAEENREGIEVNRPETVNVGITRALYMILPVSERKPSKHHKELGVNYSKYEHYVHEKGNKVVNVPISVKDFLEQKVIETDKGDLPALIKEHIIDAGIARTMEDFARMFPVLSQYVLEKYEGMKGCATVDGEQDNGLDLKIEEIVLEKGDMVKEEEEPSKDELDELDSEEERVAGNEDLGLDLSEDEASEMFIAVTSIMAENRPPPRKKKKPKMTYYRGEDIQVTAEMAALVRYYCYGHVEPGHRTSYGGAARHLGVRPSLFEAIYEADRRYPKDPKTKKPIMINEGIIERIIEELGEDGISLFLKIQGIDANTVLPDKRQRLKELISDYRIKSGGLPMVTAFELKQHDQVFGKYDAESLLLFILGDVEVPLDLIYPMHDYFKERLMQVEAGEITKPATQPLATKELNLYVIKYMDTVLEAVEEIKEKRYDNREDEKDDFLKELLEELGLGLKQLPGTGEARADMFLDQLIDELKLLQVPLSGGERAKKKMLIHKLLIDAVGSEKANQYTLNLFADVTGKKVVANLVQKLQDLKSS